MIAHIRREGGGRGWRPRTHPSGFISSPGCKYRPSAASPLVDPLSSVPEARKEGRKERMRARRISAFPRTFLDSRYTPPAPPLLFFKYKHLETFSSLPSGYQLCTRGVLNFRETLFYRRAPRGNIATFRLDYSWKERGRGRIETRLAKRLGEARERER